MFVVALPALRVVRARCVCVFHVIGDIGVGVVIVCCEKACLMFCVVITRVVCGSSLCVVVLLLCVCL